MIVPENIRKCVAFIGYQISDSTFRMAGSVFFLGRRGDDLKVDRVYAVTAKHVIDGLSREGLSEVWLRLNLKDGEAKWFPLDIKQWYIHPSDPSIDVTIFKIGLPPHLDHLVIPYSLCITENLMKEHEVGLGDEVFIIGLFRHHHGTRRNIPIVRIGNIACFTEEKILTDLFGEIDAYLIEARSIGGLSGSPVFLNLGVTRMIKGEVKFAKSDPIFYLLGLTHGHYDVRAASIDGTGGDEIDVLSPERVNTGIAIVIPFHRIDEVIQAYESNTKATNKSLKPTP